jgi:hypothetical protein
MVLLVTRNVNSSHWGHRRRGIPGRVDAAATSFRGMLLTLSERGPNLTLESPSSWALESYEDRDPGVLSSALRGSACDVLSFRGVLVPVQLGVPSCSWGTDCELSVRDSVGRLFFVVSSDALVWPCSDFGEERVDFACEVSWSDCWRDEAAEAAAAAAAPMKAM